jgi:hypothetical protein
MKRIAIGDVFSINTPKGNAYFQYACKDKNNIEMLRIFPGLFEDIPSDLGELVRKKELFLISFPLAAAYRRELVELVGSYPIPEGFQKPKYMRTDNIDRNGVLVNWYIVDTETLKREKVLELTEEQKKLSPFEIWNDTLLIEKLTEGWTLDKWV